MRLRIRLDSKKIKNLIDYSSEFLELVYISGILELCSESVETSVMTELLIIEHDSEPFSIRLPKEVLKKLGAEEVMDLIINDSTVDCIFYTIDMKFLYKMTVSKQRGFISIEDKLDITLHVDSFETHSLKSISGLIKTVSKLNGNIMCMNKIVTCEYNRSYIFVSSDLPNFYIQGKFLKKLISISNNVVFAGKYMYAYDVENDLHVFLNKLRVTEISDIEFIRKKKFSHSIKLDTLSILQLTNRFTIDSKSKIVLDLPKEIMEIKEEYRTFNLNVPILHVTTSQKKDEDTDLSKLIEGISEDTERVVDINSDVNSYNLPKLSLPKWLVMNVINQRYTTLYINKNFICLTVEGGKVLLSRSDV